MKLLLLILLVVGTACTSQRQIMDSWIGGDKQRLILSWGPPQEISSDGGNGEVLIYARQIYNSYLNQTIYQCKMMYADKDGKIYHWLTRNSPVPPQQMNVNLNVTHTRY